MDLLKDRPERFVIEGFYFYDIARRKAAFTYYIKVDPDTGKK